MQSMQVRLDALVDAPRNANRMAPARYAALKESIKRLGFLMPIVIQETEEHGKYLIDDGHHRRNAVRELGHEDVWAVVLGAGEDPRVVALALNRLRGETDLAVAAVVVAEMVEEGLAPLELQLTGFSEKEIADLVAAATQVDDVELGDLANTEVPDEVGSPTARPYLLDLTFKTKEDLASCRKALRKAAGKGNDLSEGLLRLVRGE